MLIRRVGGTTDLLGESCVWSVREQALYWVDARAPAIRRLDHARGTIESLNVPETVGSIGLREKGGLVVALESRIALLDWQSGGLQTIAAPDDTFENQRFNDGRCDRQGRFWAGTMNDVDRGKQGMLYRLDSSHRLTPMLGPLTIPNSLAWSPDGRKMYFSDTTSRAIAEYDFAPEPGIPTHRRDIAVTEEPGTPDGSTVDADGFLWNAEYDGWKVVRYAPDGGIDRVVPLSVQRPTCCAFGGPELSVLFVTTASQKLSAADLAAQPLAGGLLALEVGVRGLPEPRYID